VLAFMASRNIGEVFSLVKSNQWPNTTWAPFALCGPQISLPPVLPSLQDPNPPQPTRTVGFLGFGRIAQATLARLIPFGFTHCIYTSNPNSPPQPDRDAQILGLHRGYSPATTTKLHSLKRVDIDELAKESDVVFVLAPGGNETKHVVNEEFLKKMKKTSILVNTSRGTLVDSDALAKALKEGWIWGAGLDVVEGEPNISADHPLVKEPR
jgi:glyoxylate/hydroxypyruvate reductase